MLLRDATMGDGTIADVRVLDGHVSEIAPAHGLDPFPAEEVHDLRGHLLLPAPVEPHAHVDKAFTAARVTNPTGDLEGAVAAWLAYRAQLDSVDIATRAERALRSYVAHGATVVRTHVDVGPGIEMRALDAVVALRDQLVELVDIEIVALISEPLTGRDGADNRARLAAALDRDGVIVGGAPNFDPEPDAAIDLMLDVALERNRGLDLHVDETLDREALTLHHLACRVGAGFPSPVTASHCVSLGMQPPSVQDEVAALVAAASIGVVTLPQTNLYLQARGRREATPRGLTALVPLLTAGVAVAGGGDNVQDLFNPLGSTDPLETAALLVAAGHLSPADAYAAISTEARRVLGSEPGAVTVGARADLLAVEAENVTDALARRPPGRLVVRRGRVVSRSTVRCDQSYTRRRDESSTSTGRNAR